MPTVLTTDSIDVRDRFDAYRDAVSNTFVTLSPKVTSPRPFECQIDSHELGLLQLSAVTATPHRIERTAKTAATADRAFLKVGLQMSGRAVISQDGREAHLGAGDLAVYDTTRPYQIDFLDDYKMMVVMFPRQLLRVPAASLGEGTARTLSGRTGMGALLSPLLMTLERELQQGATANTFLNDAVLDLVAACFTDTAATNSGLSRRESLMITIKAFIEAHLSDPALDATSVAAAHHISTSYLQKLFSSESLSVAAYIRQRRLEGCRKELTDPHRRDQSAATIATHWGLVDPSHFSRIFKNAYGFTPGEYRMAAGW